MDRQQYYLLPDARARLAAIDVGTNSLRLIIAEALRDGKYRVLDDEKEATRLGRNLEASGRLDPEAVEVSIAALRRMKQIADGYQVQETRAIATCAVREAADGEEFCRRVHDEVGLELQTISAQREGRLAFLSVARNFDLEGKNVAVADIGGGSTEIVLASGTLIEEIYTTPLGAVRLAEQFATEQPLSHEDFARLLDEVDRVLRKHTPKVLFVPHVLIGTGGTFTALAAMRMAARRQTGLPTRGYLVTRADVRHQLDSLRKMSLKARRSVPGLSPDRADLIVAGLAIVDAIMRRFEVNILQVHDGGVRDGLLLQMVGQPLADQTPSATSDAEHAVAEFAGRCGVDMVHSRHVAKLARELFNQLKLWFPMPEGDGALLEAAALLQDVGYLVNYEQHHKHSYHLIKNSHLPGFTPADLELVANVARYHRGAQPKRKHEAFAALPKRDRHRVRLLAAILRLAGGFDRSHSQLVRAVRVTKADHELTMYAVADQLPEVDLWGARRRAEVFEEEFGVPLVIEWEAPGEAANALSPTETSADVAQAAERSNPSKAD